MPISIIYLEKRTVCLGIYVVTPLSCVYHNEDKWIVDYEA